MEHASKEAPVDTKRKTIVVFVTDEDEVGPNADLTPEQAKDALAELTQAIEGLRTKDTPVEMGKPFTEPFVNKAADDGYAVAKRAIQSVADTHGLVFSPHEVAALVDLGNAFSPMFAAAVAERACLSYKKHGCV